MKINWPPWYFNLSIGCLTKPRIVVWTKMLIILHWLCWRFLKICCRHSRAKENLKVSHTNLFNEFAIGYLCSWHPNSPLFLTLLPWCRRFRKAHLLKVQAEELSRYPSLCPKAWKVSFPSLGDREGKVAKSRTQGLSAVSDTIVSLSEFCFSNLAQKRKTGLESITSKCVVYLQTLTTKVCQESVSFVLWFCHINDPCGQRWISVLNCLDLRKDGGVGCSEDTSINISKYYCTLQVYPFPWGWNTEICFLINHQQEIDNSLR